MRQTQLGFQLSCLLSHSRSLYITPSAQRKQEIACVCGGGCPKAKTNVKEKKEGKHKNGGWGRNKEQKKKKMKRWVQKREAQKANNIYAKLFGADCIFMHFEIVMPLNER